MSNDNLTLVKSDNFQKEEERKIREHLSEKLGLEFCSEDEISQEIGKALVQESKQVDPLPPPVPGTEQTITVGEIIRQCNEAGRTMSIKNPNRHLFYLCGTALDQLVKRLARYENENGQPVKEIDG